MYDGLTTSAGMFVEYTIARFEEVKQLHIILLVVSLVLIIGFVWKMFRPYVRKLHTESKALAGMMSLLPAEVDIESHVKTIVLGLSKDRNSNSMRSASMPGGAYMGPGAVGQMRLLPGPGGNGSMPGGVGGSMPGGGGGWFGARGQGSAAQGGNAAGMMMMVPGGGGGGEYGAPPMGGGGGWGGGGGNARGGPHWG